jgi:predicted phosphodiesterase
MKKVLSFIILTIGFLNGTYSQVIDNENLIITHGPWLQNLDANGVTIIWTTNKPAIPGVNVTGPDGIKKFIRNSHDGIIDGGGTLHKVRVEGLEPGNTYKYSIHSVQVMKYQAYKVYYGDTLARKTETFMTPLSKSDKVSFLVVNDVHNNSGKIASYFKNANIAGKDFCIFNGDMVDFLQSTDELFSGFVDSAVTYFASKKPFYYVRGNHETRGYKAREISKYFDLKEGRYYYGFDYGNIHFTVLDCGEDKPDNNKNYFGLADYDSYRLEELEWLKGEVKSEEFRNARKRIVILHMPVLKEDGQNHAMKFMSDNFGPLLQAAGVDLMISAHTHRNTFYEAGKSGFDYPLLVNSNNSFVEVIVDQKEIRAVVKDVTGKQLSEYIIN